MRELGDEPRRIFVVAVVRRIGVQGAGLAPDRHSADSQRASAKTRLVDSAFPGLAQMALVSKSSRCP